MNGWFWQQHGASGMAGMGAKRSYGKWRTGGGYGLDRDNTFIEANVRFRAVHAKSCPAACGQTLHSTDPACG